MAVFYVRFVVSFDVGSFCKDERPSYCKLLFSILHNIGLVKSHGLLDFRRLDRPVAHAKLRQLQGFYFKIRVAKRNTYGFRNMGFFSYTRFIRQSLQDNAGAFWALLWAFFLNPALKKAEVHRHAG